MNVLKISFGQHCVPNWKWNVLPGMHPGFTIWSVWDGEGEMMLGETRYELSAGDVFFLNYKKEVCGVQNDNNPLRVRFIDFTLQKPNLAADWPEHRHYDQPLFMGELFNRLKMAQQKDDFEQSALWLQAIVMAYRCATLRQEGDAHFGKIDNLCLEFERHPEREYDIKRIALDFNCTCDHFIRMFKRDRGMTPYAYLQNVRLETAKGLLRNSNNRIKEIAESSGFSNIYNFSHFFCQKTGLTPTAFRRTPN